MPIPTGMVCRAWITINGERVYAKDHGKRAFCFFPSKKEKGDEILMPIEEIKKTAPIKQQS